MQTLTAGFGVSCWGSVSRIICLPGELPVPLSSVMFTLSLSDGPG